MKGSKHPLFSLSLSLLPVRKQRPVNEVQWVGGSDRTWIHGNQSWELAPAAVYPCHSFLPQS